MGGGRISGIGNIKGTEDIEETSNIYLNQQKLLFITLLLFKYIAQDKRIVLSKWQCHLKLYFINVFFILYT